MEMSERERCRRIAEIFAGLYESAGISVFRAEGHGEELPGRDLEGSSLDMAGSDSRKLFHALLKDYLTLKLSAGQGRDGRDAEEMAGSIVADAEKVVDEIKGSFLLR